MIDQRCADSALNMLSVDAHGFDHMDRRLLLTHWKPIQAAPGVDSLAASIGEEERDTIEDVIDLLMQQVTLRARCAGAWPPNRPICTLA